MLLLSNTIRGCHTSIVFCVATDRDAVMDDQSSFQVHANVVRREFYAEPTTDRSNLQFFTTLSHGWRTNWSRSSITERNHGCSPQTLQRLQILVGLRSLWMHGKVILALLSFSVFLNLLWTSIWILSKIKFVPSSYPMSFLLPWKAEN